MDEQSSQPKTEEGSGSAADRLVKEATGKYKAVPKPEELKGFKFEKLFEGRIDKDNYLYAFIASLLLGLVLWMIPVIGWIISIAIGVVGLGVMARRFHDMNQTGWWALIAFVPGIGLLAAIYLIFADPVDTGNTYGPKPDPARGFYHAVLNI